MTWGVPAEDCDAVSLDCFARACALSMVLLVVLCLTAALDGAQIWNRSNSLDPHVTNTVLSQFTFNYAKYTGVLVCERRDRAGHTARHKHTPSQRWRLTIPKRGLALLSLVGTQHNGGAQHERAQRAVYGQHTTTHAEPCTADARGPWHQQCVCSNEHGFGQ